MILHQNKNSIFLESTLEVSSVYESEANLFTILLLKDDLNLEAEIPAVNWRFDNDAFRESITKTLNKNP